MRLYQNLIFFTICCFVESAKTKALEWDGLTVQYGGWHPMPLNTTAATQQGWKRVKADKKLRVDLYMKDGDVRFILLFDKKGVVAGIQTGVVIKEVMTLAQKNKVPFQYRYDKTVIYSKQKKNKYFPVDFWASRILLTSPCVLKDGGRDFVPGRDEVAQGIYLKFGKKYREVPRDEGDIDKFGGYTKQACIPGMGQHYFRVNTSLPNCNTIEGFFLGYEHHRLKMVGLAFFGYKETKLPYFEDPTPEEVGGIIINRPDCMLDYARKIGAFSTHIYPVSNPQNITCPGYPW